MRHCSFKIRIIDPNLAPALASAFPGSPTVESVRTGHPIQGGPAALPGRVLGGSYTKALVLAQPPPSERPRGGGATRMCTAGAPRPPRTAGTWARDLRTQLGAGGGRARRGLRCDPHVPGSVRAIYHGRAPHAPLPTGARTMLLLGGYGGGRLEARGRLSKPLPVLPYHRALHASVAGGRTRCVAADLHSVSASQGRWGPRDV